MIFESLDAAASAGELLLVDGGLCHFHRRRDGWVTIREVVVLPGSRRRGVGRRLVSLACRGAVGCRARCPADLPSNAFWRALGFSLAGQESTRSTGRAVNVWELTPCG